MIRVNEKTRKHFIYIHQTAYDYSLWFNIFYGIGQDNFKFAILPRCTILVRNHKNRMSYDSTEVNHYTAWIPIK